MPIHIDLSKVEPAAYPVMMNFKKYVSGTEITPTLRHLIDIRASQINGCAYCIDMHTKEAKHDGEQDHRIFALNAWHETPFFTPAERAVLTLTEHVTRIADHGVPTEMEIELKQHFSDPQIGQLLMAIVHINAWNRLAISTGMQPAAR